MDGSVGGWVGGLPVVWHEAGTDGAAEEEGVVVGGMEEADKGRAGVDGGPE